MQKCYLREKNLKNNQTKKLTNENTIYFKIWDFTNNQKQPYILRLKNYNIDKFKKSRIIKHWLAQLTAMRFLEVKFYNFLPKTKKYIRKIYFKIIVYCNAVFITHLFKTPCKQRQILNKYLGQIRIETNMNS